MINDAGTCPKLRILRQKIIWVAKVEMPFVTRTQKFDRRNETEDRGPWRQYSRTTLVQWPLQSSVLKNYIVCRVENLGSYHHRPFTFTFIIRKGGNHSADTLVQVQ